MESEARCDNKYFTKVINTKVSSESKTERLFLSEGYHGSRLKLSCPTLVDATCCSKLMLYERAFLLLSIWDVVLKHVSKYIHWKSICRNLISRKALTYVIEKKTSVLTYYCYTLVCRIVYIKLICKKNYSWCVDQLGKQSYVSSPTQNTHSLVGSGKKLKSWVNLTDKKQNNFSMAIKNASSQVKKFI